MSMRPLLYPIVSIAPLRDALGSGDASLLTKVEQGLQRYYGGDVDDETRDEVMRSAEEILAADPGAASERGEWERVLMMLALGMGAIENEPVNEDWKWGAWDELREQLADMLSPEASRLLEGLVDGRPLRAEKMSNEGAYYAWLTAEEVATLRDDLGAVLERRPELASEVDGFAEVLLESLDALRDRAALLLAC